MRFHRAGATGAMLLAVAMSAAACGSGGGSTSSSTTPTTTAAQLSTKLVFGGPPECKTRPTCLLGLETVYGLHFKDFKALDSGGPLTKSALSNGQIDVARLFSSDEAIQIKGYVLLDDDKHYQLAGNVIPVIRNDKATPEVKSLLNSVSAAITQDDLTSINKAIDIDHADPGDQATQFIQKKGLNKGTTPGPKESLTVGSFNFTESVALADIYGGVLKDAGYSVSFKNNLGAREIVEPALQSGQLDLIPEYAGNALNFLNPQVMGGLTLDQTAQQLTTAMTAKGLTVLDPSNATDSDAIAVTKATADKYQLTKISDLGKKA
ncbi:MAG: osmoprotectant transport system substrate-binding protein [Acidimicrobiaceae bacterium]|jgi:osmoprotectant transport system substrate-binding protein|nr:osmoprotectant transport system substrate-binding protein [Acidimicrobiaceae bacterium]MDQ1375974.1 osmoprotectant transport system substrate-binding protein [Acidimicrobiaceae bacterium]MDQ1398112.1 osmoprotectant transport system substrate-binding protein [Acidimicrobiaceae bacterium]MDQ1415116.1 osmoprotectant transport system substrate-binding protein [Acidimicrobiaceae bacterium]MDQ1443345.1 osmoprotectant transport system substrate-binding protein [Acidimicrobiaceae bacterium]